MESSSALDVDPGTAQPVFRRALNAHHGVDQLFAVAGAETGRAILLLYRSARQPAMAEAGRDLAKAAARPGFSLLATEDHYVGSEAIRRRAAKRAGARTEVLEGLGHWWMVQDPGLGAAVLARFWDSLNE